MYASSSQNGWSWYIFWTTKNTQRITVVKFYFEHYKPEKLPAFRSKTFKILWLYVHFHENVEGKVKFFDTEEDN